MRGPEPPHVRRKRKPDRGTTDSDSDSDTVFYYSTLLITLIEEHNTLLITLIEEHNTLLITLIEEHNTLLITLIEKHNTLLITLIEKHNTLLITLIEEQNTLLITLIEKHKGLNATFLAHFAHVAPRTYRLDRRVVELHPRINRRIVRQQDEVLAVETHNTAQAVVWRVRLVVGEIEHL